MVEFIQLKRLLSIVTAFFVVGNPNGGILPDPNYGRNGWPDVYAGDAFGPLTFIHPS